MFFAIQSTSEWQIRIATIRDLVPPQIKRAYRSLLSRMHPDKGGSPEAFRAIQQAFEVLSHTQKVSA